MVKKRFTYGVNERGNLLGEAHQNAKLTDAQVEEIRTLYENGGTSYRLIARQFGVHRATIADCIKFRRRACTPDAYRTRVIEVSAEFATMPDWWKFQAPPGTFDKK